MAETVNIEKSNDLAPEPKLAGPALWWRAARDVVLLVVFVAAPFYVASLGASFEHNVCGRVIAIQGGQAEVEYWWNGRSYKTSLPADDTLKPPGQATVSLYFVGSPGTAARGRNGHAPYTALGILSTVVPFFIAGMLVMAVWQRVWGRRIAPAATQVLDLVIRRFGKEPSPKTRALSFAAISVVCMGSLNSYWQSHQPRNSPDQLARAFLAAVHDRNLNQAAYLVAYDERYEFLGVVRSWVLVDYEVLEVTNDTIRYRYTKEVAGRRTSGESELPVVHNYGGYWIGRVMPPGELVF
jgi:hypothetical protein